MDIKKMDMARIKQYVESEIARLQPMEDKEGLSDFNLGKLIVLNYIKGLKLDKNTGIMKNEFYLNDIVKLKGYFENYKVTGMDLGEQPEVYKAVRYKLCRVSDNYVCYFKEAELEPVSKYNKIR